MPDQLHSNPVVLPPRMQSAMGMAREVVVGKAMQLTAGCKAGLAIPPSGGHYQGLLFAGMGGSGATALLVKDACTRVMDLPFTIVQHYKIPNHVRDGWHTLALSYSGETEETLSVAAASVERGVPVTAFTTGGKLADLADSIVSQPAGFQPRFALGHAWFSVLGYLESQGLLNEQVPVEAAADAVRTVDAACGPDAPVESNEARQLAAVLVDKIPQLYATPAFIGATNYMRCMINENAKKIARIDMVPECNHNDLVGWNADPMRKHFAAVTFSHGNQNPQIQERLDFMGELYERNGVPWYHKQFRAVNSFEDHVIAQAEMVQFADYVSLYLAELQGVDPLEITAIEALKARLRQ